MSNLYFLGVRKSTIKKTQPFKYLFDLRDKRVYKQVMQSLAGKIEDYSNHESIVTYTVNGKSLKLLFRKFPCSDLHVFQQVIVLGCYEPIMRKMLSHYPASAKLKVIDAGANVGYASIYFKSFFPFAEIDAIEPEQQNQQQLEKNIALNSIQLNRLIRGALWKGSAVLEVARDFRDNRDASFTMREITSGTGIAGFSFDDILRMNEWTNVDLLKIDIEGGERFLFSDTEKADSILKKTKFLAIEIHDEFDSRQMIYSHLKRNYFDYFESGDLTFAVNTKESF
jgi:FkbM family methyltransferase